MKRQNFIRKIAKATAEEYGPELTDFELDAVLMTLENHGFDVSALFHLSDGDADKYINQHWNDEDYLKDCNPDDEYPDDEYYEPNGYAGQEGADAVRVMLDDEDNVIARMKVKWADLPDEVKAELPR